MITKSLADSAPAPSPGEEGEELCSLACLGQPVDLQSLRGTADQGPGPPGCSASLRSSSLSGVEGRVLPLVPLL